MHNLIKNEFIKLLKKKTTYIWLVGVMLISIAATLLLKIESKRDLMYSGGYSGSEYSKEYYNEEINNAKRAKLDGYENEVKYYEELISRKIYVYCWEMEALSVAYRENSQEGEASKDNNKSDEYKKRLISAVDKDDYKEFLKIMIERTNSSKDTTDDDADSVNVYQLMYDYDIPFAEESVKGDILEDLNQKKAQLSELKQSSSDDENVIKSVTDAIKIDEYKLKNDICNYSYSYGASIDSIYAMKDNCWKYLKFGLYMSILVSLLMVIIAGNIVATEYASGTIKFYLLDPKKRRKKILSKYFTVIILSFVCMAIYFIINLIMGIILGGTGELTAQYLYVSGGIVKSYPVILMIIIEFLVKTVQVIVMATMAFAISTLFKNSAISTGIGVACLLGGSFVNALLAELKVDWGRMLIFANVDFIKIKENLSLYGGHTLTGALVNVVLHMIVFIWIAYDAFVRRDV